MLVVPKETKEMIQAMVAAQSQKLSTAPDIIAGKGNGLLILLHGGPGTGKTLTAESIAELQERPLYRITCGDVGLEPDQVEKVSLESCHHQCMANEIVVSRCCFAPWKGLGMWYVIPEHFKQMTNMI